MSKVDRARAAVRFALMNSEEVATLSDGDKLRLIAAWFDIQDKGTEKPPEVQEYLMRIADKVDGLDKFLSTFPSTAETE